MIPNESNKSSEGLDEARYQFSSKYFFDLLLNTQKYLHKENSLYEYQKLCNNHESSNIAKDIESITIELKRTATRYILILMELDKESFDQNIEPVKLFKNILKGESTIEYQERSLIDLDHFIKLCNEINIGLKSIIYFSLGTLPSYFNFLMTEESISRFLEFIKKFSKGDDARYGEYIRFVFLTPAFVNFISQAFKPIFLPYAISLTPVSNQKKFCEDLLQGWKDKIALCPYYVHGLLNQNNYPGKLLYNAFFAHLIRFPAMYLVVHPYQVDLPDLFINLGTTLESTAEQFVDAMKNLNVNTPIFSTELSNASKESFRFNPFDSIDLTFLEGPIQINSCMKSFKSLLSKIETANYHIYMISNKHDKPTESDITYQSENESMTSIRELLKMSPLLSSSDYEDQMSVSHIIKEFLVEKGPFTQMPLRISYYQKILIDNGIPNTENELEDFFNFMKSKHSKPDIILSNQTTATQKLKRIKLLSRNIIKHINECTTALYYDRYLRKPIKKQEEFYYQNPKDFLYDFNSWVQLNNQIINDIFGDYKDKIILYHLFSKDLHFQKYISIRNELSQIDSLIKHLISRYSFQVIEVLFGKMEKEFHCLFSIHQQMFDTIRKQIIFAYNVNSNPIQKIIDICSTFYSLIKYATDESSSVLGYDASRQLYAAAILYLNPDCLFSSYIYSKELTFISGFDELINNYADDQPSTVNILQEIIDYFSIYIPHFPDFSSSVFCKSLQHKFKIALCGSFSQNMKLFIEGLTTIKIDFPKKMSHFNVKLPYSKHLDYYNIVENIDVYRYETLDKFKLGYQENKTFDVIILVTDGQNDEKGITSFINASKDRKIFIFGQEPNILQKGDCQFKFIKEIPTKHEEIESLIFDILKMEVK